MNLIQNIQDNINSLQNDFIGLSINFVGISQFISHLILTVIIFTTFYLVGDKIRRAFFIVSNPYNNFVSVALGYITIGTGIGILGIFSLLTTNFIIAYIVIVLVIAFYPPVPEGVNNKKLNQALIKAKSFINIKKYFFEWVVVLFIVISFLRLMTPEIAEDGYHTDLPQLYISWQTTLYESQELLRVIPYPQLPEMIYLIPIFLGEKETARFIHFGFYSLIFLLLFKVGTKYKYTKFAPLLFVSAPIVIRYSPTQHTDFFAVYCFLLAALIVLNKTSTRKIILSGILFGAVISVKIWMLVYLPAFILYLVYITKKKALFSLLKMSTLFISASLLVSLLWHVRAYIITGNPLFPIFSKWQLLGASEPTSGSVASFIGFNIKMFSYENLIVYSPLFFLGIFFLLISGKRFLAAIKDFPIAVLSLLIFMEQLFIQVYLGRYLLTFYTISTMIISASIVLFIRNSYTKYILGAACIILIAYYSINTLLILPYGFGWADKNKYLTRVLGRDNVSYYDFDRIFDKRITKDDLVATYGIGSYYYADFNYVDMGYIYDGENRSFELFEKKGVTKILIKGGDIEWFAKKISMIDYDKNKVTLLATYPADIKKYNLYEIKK